MARLLMKQRNAARGRREGGYTFDGVQVAIIGLVVFFVLASVLAGFRTSTQMSNERVLNEAATSLGKWSHHHRGEAAPLSVSALTEADIPAEHFVLAYGNSECYVMVAKKTNFSGTAMGQSYAPATGVSPYAPNMEGLEDCIVDSGSEATALKATSVGVQLLDYDSFAETFYSISFVSPEDDPRAH